MSDRARHAGDPAAGKLPVPVSVAGWDGADDLATWLARRLKEEWHLAPAIGRTLVRRQLILPVLDGLDEIGVRDGRGKPADKQLRVLRRLNMALGSGDVVYAPAYSVALVSGAGAVSRAGGGPPLAQLGVAAGDALNAVRMPKRSQYGASAVPQARSTEQN